MKRSLLVSVMVLLLSIILVRRIEAQQPATASLTVSVMDSTGAVIPEATVEAFAGQKEVARGKTGPDGKAVLGLARGLYEIRAEAQAFRSEKAQFDITENSPVSYKFCLRVWQGGGPRADRMGEPDDPVRHLPLWTPSLDDVCISPPATPLQVRLRTIRRVH